MSGGTSEMATHLYKLSKAANTFGVLGADMWDGVGGMFTCDEAEAIRYLLQAIGAYNHADFFMLDHARADKPEEGDRHKVSIDGNRVVRVTP